MVKRVSLSYTPPSLKNLAVGLGLPFVELNKISKSYGDQTVIDNISLSLQANLTTALVGESGSGKSTILQIINGIVVPEAGQILLNGESMDYRQIAKIRRTMGYAVQGAGLFPHMNVKKNVTLMAQLEKWSPAKIDERYRYLFDLLELPLDFSDRYPHSLSGGQQQRVSLCRAMMLNPPLMLLDEPFSALDPITRSAIHDEFIHLQNAESRSILLVTHDMSEAVKLAQYLVILKEGKIVQMGKINEVRDNPVNDYVRRLFRTEGQNDD